MDGRFFGYQGLFGDDSNSVNDQISASVVSTCNSNDSDSNNSINEKGEEIISSNLYQIGTTIDNLFPHSRLGYFVTNKLEKLGIETHTLQKNFLFFLQLAHPLGDPDNAGVECNIGQLYYSQGEQWSNLYACSIGLGGSYGHKFKSVSFKEMIHYYGYHV